MKTAEETYTDWFGSANHTTRRSPSKANVIAAMEEYASQDRWIPVSERLPDQNSMVIIYRQSPCGEIKNVAPDFYTTIFQHVYVTHWQPLPQPPINEREEG